MTLSVVNVKFNINLFEQRLRKAHPRSSIMMVASRSVARLTLARFVFFLTSKTKANSITQLIARARSKRPLPTLYDGNFAGRFLFGEVDAAELGRGRLVVLDVDHLDDAGHRGDRGRCSCTCGRGRVGAVALAPVWCTFDARRLRCVRLAADRDADSNARLRGHFIRAVHDDDDDGAILFCFIVGQICASK